jgi:hypothetical protein
LENNVANENISSSSTPKPQGAHLVGSVPLANAEEVFRTASSILGERLHRIPDGETGVRTNWIGWQIAFFENNPAFELIPPEPNAYTMLRRFKLRSIASGKPLFDNLGYADAAITSYTIFSQFKQAGTIPAHCRFQVCLPTPIAPVVAFVMPGDMAAVEPAYETGMLHELDRISAAIPHDELAIQWDVAIEFGILEGVMPSFLSDSKTELLARLIRLGNSVQADIEMGYHLCYGDAGHSHFKQPEDASKLVEVANALAAGVKRTINWIHMPVPRDRSDDAYFAPLKNLKLHPETELYLGLVHYTDGSEGTQKRIAVAKKFVSEFGVATECGFGRRLAETIPNLMRIHREVSTPISV